jgi:hypothetical protein
VTDRSLEPDCYVKLADGEGGTRWVACKSLGLRERNDEEGEFHHVEVLVRPVGTLTMAWVHANLTVDEPPSGVEVDVA